MRNWGILLGLAALALMAVSLLGCGGGGGGTVPSAFELSVTTAAGSAVAKTVTVSVTGDAPNTIYANFQGDATALPAVLSGINFVPSADGKTWTLDLTTAGSTVLTNGASGTYIMTVYVKALAGSTPVAVGNPRQVVLSVTGSGGGDGGNPPPPPVF